MEILYLSLFAFLAGLIDAVVGGGGLIQLPALFVFLPQMAVPMILGTGKLSSIAGTTASMFRYARNVEINWRAVLPAAATAFVFSFLGARAVSHFNTEMVRPLILVLLISVALYTFFRKDFGAIHAPRLAPSKEVWYGIGVGMTIGFYDGFFGPGTGSFLMFVFVGVFGFNFLASSASAKVVNVATNLSALLYFGYKGYILYHIGIPMAISSIIGSMVGTRIALAQGSGFVRKLFLVVVTGIIFKFAYDTFLK